MNGLRIFLVACWLAGLLAARLALAESVTLAGTAGASFERYPASGAALLLWMASERGWSDAEMRAAESLARAGVEVWQWDVLNSYLLPALPGSLDRVPGEDVGTWIGMALGTGKRVTLLAIARAAKPALRAVAALPAPARAGLCVVLLYPNLYTDAEPLSEPAYLPLGRLDGVRVLVLQPRRSASTPWLPALTAALTRAGAVVETRILEKLREGFWVREDATPFEVEAGNAFGALLLRELTTWECGK